MNTITEDEFIELVRRAEQDAEAKPGRYTRRLALFALLGYSVIILVMVLLLGITGGLLATTLINVHLLVLLISKKFIFALLATIWVLFRALWVKIPPPEGYVLRRRDFPRLFNELDKLCKQLDALKIHQVLLTREFNAAVVQTPRLGILGWQKNYLILGYPLLLTLTPEEMRSVLAHELGHLSGNHSRFNGWIYRVRTSWLRIMNSLNNDTSKTTWPLRKFFDWYSPRFEAYSFALARKNEYEADAVASELTSPDTATSALIKVHSAEPYINQSYWDVFFKKADTQERPEHAPFEGLASFLKNTPLPNQEMTAQIQEAMKVQTQYADTHPSLKDRILRIGGKPTMMQAMTSSAATEWLGDRATGIMKHFDDLWMEEYEKPWKERYEYATNARKHLDEYSNKDIKSLNDTELWNYAYWKNEFESADEALPLFQTFLARHPGDTNASYFTGHILLDKQDNTGLELLRTAMNNSRLIENAARVGYAFLKKQGKDEDAKAWWDAAIKQNEFFIQADSERSSVTGKDQLASPQISDEMLAQLVSQLKQHKKVKRAWLAEKVIQHRLDDPVYIVAFSPRGFSLSTKKLAPDVAASIHTDSRVFFICTQVNGRRSALAKKVIKNGKRIL